MEPVTQQSYRVFLPDTSCATWDSDIIIVPEIKL